MSYDSVHYQLKKERGSAAEHPCHDCGMPALDWSYDNAAGDQELVDPGTGYRYAEDLQFYQARCRPCHKRLDLRANPEHLEWKREQMSKVAREHPPSTESRSRAGKARAKAMWDRYYSDPAFKARRDTSSTQNAVSARSALQEKHSADPTLRDLQTAAMKRAKAKCLECGLVSRPGSIAMHQKYTHHQGVEAA